MAMRPRGRYGNQPVRRPSTRQSSEQFRPRSEWKDENDAIILLVYLPGFMREQIRMMFTYVDDTSLGMRVQGQRPLPTGGWSRFSEVYIIPKTCDASKITSNFENAVLRIVMPKLVVGKQNDDLKPVAEAKATQASTSSPQQTVGDQKTAAQTSEVSANAMDQKPREEKKLVEAQTSQKMKGEIETSSELAAAAVEKPREEKTDGAPTTQKGEVESTTPKAASTVDNNQKQTDEKRVVSGPFGGESKGDQDQKVEKKKETSDEAAVDEKPAAESEKPQNNVEEKVLSQRKDSAASEVVAAKTEEKEKDDDDGNKSSKTEDEEGSPASKKAVPAPKTEEEKEKNDDDGKESSKAEDEEGSTAAKKAVLAPKAEEEKEKNDDDGKESSKAEDEEGSTAAKKNDDDDDDKKISKSKDKEDFIDAEKSKEDDGAGLEESQDQRQLFINMGTALLVIFGLGAFVSYTITSSGKH